MRKLLLLSFLSFVAVSLTVVNFIVRAQESSQGSAGVSLPEDKMMVLPPIPGGSTQPFLGQSHFYSYVFRGNGEAVVTAKIVLANTSQSETLKETTLRFPNYEPKELTVYQILGTGQCIRYDTPGYDPARGGYYPPKCVEYGEPDYYGYYGEAKYQKAQFDYKGDTLTVKLPKEISPQKSGAFFVYFRVFGITSKNVFGAYKYNIETLKVDDQINQLSLGINTDSDLFLKGAKGEVNYRMQESDVFALKAAPVSADAVGSPAIDRFLGSVGYGTITKTASNLAPLESYKVEGSYAKNKFQLYAKETAIGIGVFLVLLIIFLLVAKVVYKSLSKDSQNEANAKSAEKSSKGGGVSFLTSLGISFVSSVSIGLYTALVIFLVNLINNYGNFSYQYQPVIALFLAVISFCVYAFLLFAPGAFWGYKKGLGWGIGVVMMTIGWLFMFFAITLSVLFFLGKDSGGGGYPIPMMTKSAQPAMELDSN